MTVNARLIPPNSGAPVAIDIKGSRDRFADLVGPLATQIGQALKITAGTAWSPQDEAKKFFEEAQWALKWGMSKQAVSAVESCWASGQQDEGTALFRLECYRAEYLACRNDYAFSIEAQPAAPPDTNVLKLCLKAFELYRKGLAAFCTNAQDIPEKWANAGNDLDREITQFLEQFYVTGEDENLRHKEELAQIRDDVRRTVRALYPESYFGASLRGGAPSGQHGRGDDRQWELKQGVFCCETPEECIGKLPGAFSGFHD